MVWTVIWISLGTIVAFFMVIFLFVLFAQFSFGVELFWLNQKATGKAFFWFSQPWLVSLNYNFDGNYSFKILGWNMHRNESSIEDAGETVDEKGDAQGKGKDIPESTFETDQPVESRLEKEPPMVSAKDDTDSVAKETGKGDNFIERLKKNKIVFFLRSKVWREKVIAWAIKLPGRFFHTIKIDHLKLNVKAGIEDPVLLGKIYGLFESVRYGLGVVESKYEIAFEPVFMENHIEGSGAVRIKSSISSLLAPVIIGIFTFPILSTFLLWRKSKKHEK
jgi:hypothetical protein